MFHVVKEVHCLVSYPELYGTVFFFGSEGTAAAIVVEVTNMVKGVELGKVVGVLRLAGV